MTGNKAARFGFVAIVGRPNVGKSTLMNALVGEKISIVSPKPHTTRHSIRGVMNRDGDQAVFVDTPGHAQRSRRVLHRLMMKAVKQAISDCELILFVIDARGFGREDQALARMLESHFDRTILVLNKIDTLNARSDLLPVLKQVGDLGFASYVPITARRRESLGELVEEIYQHLPVGPAMFPTDITTDRDIAFRSAEIIREKLMMRVRQEIPYGLTVEAQHISRADDGQWIVHGLIWVERESHKPIVIGKQGALLKQAGSDARVELMTLFGDRVHLELWVKVREHWSDSEQALQQLGYDIE